MEARLDQSATVLARTDLSPTCFRLVLGTETPISAVPGQFGMLSCDGGFDPLLRRAFSLAAVEAHRHGARIEMLIKEVGRGTSRLRHAVDGSVLHLLAPLGNGFTLRADEGERLALVAGGIGLPPVLFAAERLAKAGTPFDLYFGAATAAELIELDRCTAAVETVGGELVLVTDDGSRGETGFVTAALSRRLEKGRGYARALACGPDPMLKALARLADATGLAAEVSLEEPMGCGVGVCLGCVVELTDGRMVPSCKEGPVFSTGRLAERWWR